LLCQVSCVQPNSAVPNIMAAVCCQESSVAFSGRTSGGLSQLELDKLLGVGADEDSDEPESPEGSEDLILRTKRTRHFIGSEAADALIMNATRKVHREVSDEIAVVSKSGGLSQDELDALSTSASEDAASKPGSPSDASLFCVRRRRHFMGSEAADAFASDALSQMQEGTCQVEAPRVGGLSQAELDAFCVDEEPGEPEEEDIGEFLLQCRRRRHFQGREQADAWARETRLATSAPEKSVGQEKGGLSQSELDSMGVCGDEDEGDDEAFLLRVRRARRFLGNEAADALSREAFMSAPQVVDGCKDQSDDTSSTASAASGTTSLVFFSRQCSRTEEMAASLPTSGLDQAELDALGIQETAAAVVMEKVEKVQRKVKGLCIEIGPDDSASADIAAILQVPSPNRHRGPAMNMCSSPQHV